MRLAVCSITHHSVHSVDMVRRHVLDWRLQIDKRFHLFLCHDGPIEGREDRVSLEDIDWGDQASFVIYPERRRFWGAYCRQEWLHDLDPEKYPFVFFCCADDQICPKFVEIVLQNFTPELDAVMFPIQHHHYNYAQIPMGTGPYVNRADWASGILRTSVAKAANINFPEEYAADGLFWQDCLRVSGGDERRFKIISSSLVFKN